MRHTSMCIYFRKYIYLKKKTRRRQGVCCSQQPFFRLLCRSLAGSSGWLPSCSFGPGLHTRAHVVVPRPSCSGHSSCHHCGAFHGACVASRGLHRCWHRAVVASTARHATAHCKWLRGCGRSMRACPTCSSFKLGQSASGCRGSMSSSLWGRSSTRDPSLLDLPLLPKVIGFMVGVSQRLTRVAKWQVGVAARKRSERIKKVCPSKSRLI